MHVCDLAKIYMHLCHQRANHPFKKFPLTKSTTYFAWSQPIEWPENIWKSLFFYLVFFFPFHGYKLGSFLFFKNKLRIESTDAILKRRKENAFFFLIYFFNSFILMCIQCLGHFFPLPPLPLNPLASRQKLFCSFLQFCWTVGISNNKKDKAIMLV
jgi:hypothetical protein